MELAGKVIAILEARSGVSKATGNPWKMQDYVIETNEQYPRRMVFNVFGEDKINQFNIQMGEEINVFFDVNAHEYQGRWYNDLRAWKIERITAEATGQPEANQVSSAVPGGEPVPPSFVSSDPADDLPF